MEREELLALLRGNEWDEFEAKEATNGVSKSSYTTVSAFANTKGGWLLFGVAEEKTGLVGLPPEHWHHQQGAQALGALLG